MTWCLERRARGFPTRGRPGGRWPRFARPLARYFVQASALAPKVATSMNSGGGASGRLAAEHQQAKRITGAACERASDDQRADRL